MKTRTAKILKWTGIAIIALAALYVILLVAATTSLKHAYAALEADGRPMTAGEIIPPEIPDTDNAALVHEAVILQLKSESAGEKDLLSRLDDVADKMLEETPDAETIATYRRLSAKPVVREALAAIERGSTKPGYRNGLDYFLGAALELPHLQDMRSLSRLLAASVRLQTVDGDHAAARQTALTALRLANTLKDEPLLISQLVRLANLGVALDAVQHLDLSSGASSPDVREIEAVLRGFEDPVPFAKAIDGERLLFGEWAFNLSASELRSLQNWGDPDGTIVQLEYLFPPLKRRDYAAYLTIMHALTSCMVEPYSPDDGTLAERSLCEVPRYCFLTRLAVPALGKIKIRMVSGTARSRVTRAGLAALQYREKTGNWPKDLQALGADDLVDPFTGKALIYRPHPDGFTVYSIGENLADDGGANDGDGKDDIAWQYSEPPAP